MNMEDKGEQKIADETIPRVSNCVAALEALVERLKDTVADLADKVEDAQCVIMQLKAEAGEKEERFARVEAKLMQFQKALDDENGRKSQTTPHLNQQMRSTLKEKQNLWTSKMYRHPNYKMDRHNGRKTAYPSYGTVEEQRPRNRKNERARRHQERLRHLAQDRQHQLTEQLSLDARQVQPHDQSCISAFQQQWNAWKSKQDALSDTIG